MGAAQTKTNATQNEVNIIIIKIDDWVAISPKVTSHRGRPLSKDDLLPLQVTERLGERLQNINLWKFELEKVFKLVLILKRQFFNDLGSQTTRDITAEIELLMVEKRRLEYGIQVIWQSWYSLSF